MNMIVIIVILILLILLLAVRISNNNDVIRDNSKDKRKDIANMKNARRFFSKKKTFKYMMYLILILTAIFLICDFSSIDASIINYFSYDFYEEQPFNRYYYLAPIYIFVIRQIIIEVKVGDFLFKYFKVDEPVLQENLLLTLITKKKPAQKNTPVKEEVKNETDKNNKEEPTKDENKDETKKES